MSSLSRRGWLTIWCWLALQLWLHSSNAADPTLTVVENSSEYHQPVVSLRCQGSGASDAVTFFNKVGNITREVRTDENEPRTENSLSFQLNQTNEGIYICQINGADSNEELLVGMANTISIFSSWLSQYDNLVWGLRFYDRHYLFIFISISLS